MVREKAVTVQEVKVLISALEGWERPVKSGGLVYPLRDLAVSSKHTENHRDNASMGTTLSGTPLVLGCPCQETAVIGEDPVPGKCLFLFFRVPGSAWELGELIYPL